MTPFVLAIVAMLWFAPEAPGRGADLTMSAVRTVEQPDAVPTPSRRLRISPKRMRQIAWVVAFILVRAVRAPVPSAEGLGAAPVPQRGLVLDRHLHVRRHLQPCHARPRPADRPGRPGVAVPVHVAVGGLMGRGALRPAVALASLSRGVARRGHRHGRDRHAHRPSRAAAVRSVPRAHHADGGRGHHRAAQGAAVPERRRWVLGRSSRAAPSRRSVGRRSRSATPRSTATASASRSSCSSSRSGT